MELLDAHMHYAACLNDVHFDAIRSQAGISACVLQCIPQMGVVSTVPHALLYKTAHAAGTVYVNGGFSRATWVLLRNQPDRLAQSLVTQTKMLLDAGCDGIKLLEGKPDIRRAFPVPNFDSVIWEPFWQFAETEAIPITMHVNDPADFWDAQKINPYAKSEGWFYGPESVNNEDQYRQMDQVLTRHPRLHLQLAHMYFFSEQLPRLAALLRAYPQVRVDLTPGIEMYINMARNLPAAHAFFAEFGNRILYGSDIGSRASIAVPPRALDAEESMARVQVIRTFLETSEPYQLMPDGKYLFRIDSTPMQGLGFTDAQKKSALLEAIYGGNARALYGTPRTVELNRVAELCNAELKNLQALQKGSFITNVHAQSEILQDAMARLHMQ